MLVCLCAQFKGGAIVKAMSRFRAGMEALPCMMVLAGVWHAVCSLQRASLKLASH